MSTNPAPVGTALTDADQQHQVLAALDRATAVIEFALDGTILSANANFLAAVGYELAEVVGQHHRIFCLPDYVETDEYRAFWNRLAMGTFESGEFLRVTKDGREIWLQATYNPVLDREGRPTKVVKFASDITEAKLRAAEFKGKVTAIDRAQAVIEFAVDGTVLAANKNFLKTMGYDLDEVVGRHHRVFCDAATAASQEYQQFWERLGRGGFESGEYARVRKDGSEVWLQATYNPILDDNGRVLKVVKFASDVTEAKLRSNEIEARLKAVDRAQAVVEFDLEGVVLNANENFLRTMGYSLREIVGKHHSAFCSADYTRSEEYRDFWLRLGRGEFIGGRFERVGNYGREVHIQATYNPVLDLQGRVTKIVKYAYDITAQVQRERAVAESTAGITEAVTGLTASIADVAERSATATSSVLEARQQAEAGAEALRSSLEAIGRIERSADAIGEIVRVMADIASQTNLLAFNASIEAARAGEHGVGFSIVAGEVRKLAERSSQAAQEVGQLIGQSTEQVVHGAEVTRRAERAFELIVSGVVATSTAVQAISHTTEEQQDISARVRGLLAALEQAERTS
jgi:methyl-accepting chemotaxis protein